jgi:hypothetical protein
MISEISVKQSINESIKVLKYLNLYKGIGNKSLGNHSDAFKKVSRKNRHVDIYNVAIENQDYEILLIDDSNFQFGVDNKTLRYAFIENPNVYVTKEDFLTYQYSADDLLAFTDEELIELQNSIDEEEYEQYLNEQDLNLEAHIIRYDLDTRGYDPLVHSYSHIHVGLNKNLRIPCSKVLTPLSFIFFTIKHTYYKEWKKGIVDSNLQLQLLTSKKACLDLPKEKWVELEKHEFYLL